MKFDADLKQDIREAAASLVNDVILRAKEMALRCELHCFFFSFSFFVIIIHFLSAVWGIYWDKRKTIRPRSMLSQYDGEISMKISHTWKTCLSCEMAKSTHRTRSENSLLHDSDSLDINAVQQLEHFPLFCSSLKTARTSKRAVAGPFTCVADSFRSCAKSVRAVLLRPNTGQ